MKKICLLPFFDLVAGTYNQKALYNHVYRVVEDETKSRLIINGLTKHMVGTTKPSGDVVAKDTVLEHFRSNQYDVDLILDYNFLRDGNLTNRDHGYVSCWTGDDYQLAFKRRVPPTDGSGLKPYYEPTFNIQDYGTRIFIDHHLIKIREELPKDTVVIVLNQHYKEGQTQGTFKLDLRKIMETCALDQTFEVETHWEALTTFMVDMAIRGRAHHDKIMSLILDGEKLDLLLGPTSATVFNNHYVHFVANYDYVVGMRKKYHETTGT